MFSSHSFNDHSDVFDESHDLDLVIAIDNARTDADMARVMKQANMRFAARKRQQKQGEPSFLRKLTSSFSGSAGTPADARL